MTIVAFLGTGLMGRPMAANLARSGGIELRAWNRSPDKAAPLADDGAQVETDPVRAAHGADVLITMLYDADAVAEVAGGALGELAPDAVWVQMSTVGVEGTKRLAAQAAEAGVAFVDAPVLGTVKPATEGKLQIRASGPGDLLTRLAPVFAPLGTVLPGLGSAGEGSALKLVANAWVLTVLDGTANALALAGSLGLEPKLFLAAIDGSLTDSPYAHLKGGAMIARDYPVSFALSGALKDAGLIGDATREAGGDAALIDTIAGHLRVATDAGHGDQDMAAVIEAYPR